MVASPVTLKPLFEGDEEMRALGGPGYLAELTGNSAALIGARDFAEQIYDLALLRELVRVGRDMVQRALATSADVDPRGRIEDAEIALYRVPVYVQLGGRVQTFAQVTLLAVDLAELALTSVVPLSGL